jgi:integrase
MQTKLTKAMVRGLLRDGVDRDISFFDNEVPRMALRVKPSGAAWYFVRYTQRGRDRRMKVGDPKTMSLEEARKAAKSSLAIADSGRDPKAERDAARSEWTVRQLLEEYFDSEAFAAKTARSQYEDRSKARVHLFPSIGAHKIGELDAATAKRLYNRISRTDRAVSTTRGRRRIGGAGIARKVIRLLSAALSWAVEQGHLKNHPFKGEIRLEGDSRRDAILEDRGAYQRLFTTMDEMVAEGELRQQVRDIVTLLALTGARRNEIRALRWRHIDLESGRIVLPASEHKAGRKTRRPRIMSLVPAAQEIITRQPEGADDELVFQPLRGRLVSVNRDWRQIRKRAGLPSDLVLHSLRHSLGSHGAMAGMSAAELQALLGHSQLGTTSRYIKWAEQRATPHDRAVAAAMGGLGHGKEEDDDTKVVEIKER